MRPTREMRPRAIITSGLGGAIVGSDSSSTDEGEHVLVIEGGRDQGFAHGGLGAAEDIDPTDGNVHTGTLDDDCTITLLAPDTTRVNAVTTIELYLTEDGTGGWTPTFDADGGTIVWPGGSAPSHTTSANSLTRYVFETTDDGVTWYGIQVGGSSLTVEDEGTPLATSATNLDFVGAGVTVSGTGTTKTITIPGGGANPADDEFAWMPLTTVVGGEPVLVWDGDDNLIPTLTPV